MVLLLRTFISFERKKSSGAKFAAKLRYLHVLTIPKYMKRQTAYQLFPGKINFPLDKSIFP